MDNYKLIIFDCDGTLVDSESLSNKLIATMMNEVGIPMTEAKSLKLFKGTHFKLITDYVNSNSPKVIDFNFEERFRERCEALFKSDLKTIDGVIPFIKKLRIPYCVASNGPRIKMKTSLAVTGLDTYFDKKNIFSAYDISKFKPLPDLFLHASKSMNCVSSECLVIEDTVPGIEAALAAKMEVWAVHHPGINDEILKYEIKHFQSFNEIEL